MPKPSYFAAGKASMPGIHEFAAMAGGFGETQPEGAAENAVLSFDEKGNLTAVNGVPVEAVPDNLPDAAFEPQ